MFMASHPAQESKCETELDNIAMLKELKLFFTSNKHQGLESQDCLRYNSVLEAYNAILVYAEGEHIHKLWINDEALESKDAIETLDAIIESLEGLHIRIHINHTAVAGESDSSGTQQNVESNVANFSQKAQAVTGYYESNDILFLRDALLNKVGLRLDADNSILKNGYRTYLVPPFCGADGLAALNGLKETICIALLGKEKTKQILCPYRMKGCQHWVTICILVANQNSVYFKLHDSANLYHSEEIEKALEDFFKQPKAFSEFIAQSNRIPKLTKADTQQRLKDIFFDVQGVKKINFGNQGKSDIYAIQADTGNIYCGGYITRLIVSLTLAPEQDVTKERVWNCGGKEDKNLREEDAQTITEYNSSKISIFGRKGNGFDYKNTSAHLEKDVAQKRKTKEALFQIESILHTLDEKTLSDMYEIISRSTLNLEDGGKIKNILIDIYKKHKEKLSLNNPLSYFFDGQPVEIDENSKLDSGLLFVEIFKEFKGILIKKLGIKTRKEQLKDTFFRNPLISDELENIVTLCSQAEIQAFAKKREIPLNMPKPDATNGHEREKPQKQPEKKVENEGVPEMPGEDFGLFKYAVTPAYQRNLDSSLVSSSVESSLASPTAVPNVVSENEPNQSVQANAGRDVIVIKSARANEISVGGGSDSQNTIMLTNVTTGVLKVYVNKPALDEAALSPKQCLIELQQKLVEHCQDEHWYLKRLFDDIKTPIENSYISLSIITADEQQRKQKQLEEVDNANSDRIFRTIDERMPSHEDLFVHKEPIGLSDLFKTESGEYEPLKRLIVFGRAGIGKSILCQYLTIRWYQEVLGNSAKPLMLNPSEEIKGKVEKVPLPWLQNFKLIFWIRLREIPALLQASKKNGSLKNMINHCCYGGKADQDMLEVAIKAYQQESLFILDGYDEIEEVLDKDSSIHQPGLLAVWNILKEQPNVILTSRPRNLDLWPRDKTVRRLEVMGFSNEQVEDYVQNFMAESPNKELSGSNLLTYLKSRASIWGVAHIPINLEMLCWVYRERKISNTTNSLFMLYEKIIEAIVFEMPKKHKALNGWLEMPLGKEDMQHYALKEIGLQFLAHLAYQGILKNELLLSSKTIELSAKAVLGAHKISYDKGLTERLLETSSQLGLLCSTGQGGKSIADQSHYFIHLSFQEHFGARYVASRLTSPLEEKEKHEDTLIRQIQENKHHSRYQLMWWLTAGLLAHKGIEENDFDSLKLFAHAAFLSFLSQDYMSEADFRLAIHCLDECLGSNKSILAKMLNNAEHENLQKKMRTYFSYSIFYPQSTLRGKNFETLERCSNFFSMSPFIDALFFEKLIAFAKSKFVQPRERMQAWETLLKMPAYANQAAEGLIAFAQDKSTEIYYRTEAWKTLLKTPTYANQAAEGSIAFAQDKSIDIDKRMQVWKVLLTMPEQTNQVAAKLITYAQDKDISANERIQIWEILLLETPQHSKQAAEALIACVQDKGLKVGKRMQVWRILFKTTPEYANQVAKKLIECVQGEGVLTAEIMMTWIIALVGKIPNYSQQAAEKLTAYAQDESVLADVRMQFWEILLMIPEQTDQVAAKLIVWIEGKSVDTYERMKALELLLKVPKYSKQAAEALIACAQDKSILPEERMSPWEALGTAFGVAITGKNINTYKNIETLELLLKITEHSKQAAEALIVCAKDENVSADERMHAWIIVLSNIPEYSKQAAEALATLTQDKNVDNKKKALELLLKIPEYADQAAEGLIELAQGRNFFGGIREDIWKIFLEIPGHINKIAARLILFAQNKSMKADERILVWKILLTIPEHAKQAAEGLVSLAQDKSISAFERMEIWSIFLIIPEHANQAVEGLIALAQDKGVSDRERMLAWAGILLEKSEYANQAAEGLSAFAQDKSINAEERMKAWTILLEKPEHANQAAESLIAWAQDKSVEIVERMQAWIMLLAIIPKHTKQAAEALIAFAQDESIKTYYRIQIWGTLLKTPGYANQATAGLIALTPDKSVSDDEKICAWEKLSEVSEHIKELEQALIAFAQDKSIDARRRKRLLVTFLETVYANQAAELLIVWTHDKNINTYERREIWEKLSKMPERPKTMGKVLIIFAQDESISIDERILAWGILLTMPECANQAIEALIALTQDKRVRSNERMQAWEKLSKTSKPTKEVEQALIVFVQDKSVNTYDRKQVLETFLKTSVYASQATELLIVWMQDNNADAYEKTQIWEILFKISEPTKEVMQALIAFTQDKNVETQEKIQIWKKLSKISKHTKEVEQALIILFQDKSVND